MKKIFLALIAPLFAFVLAFNGVAFGWGASGGDGSNYGQLQETAVFFNNSGATLSCGMVVVLDRSGTGVTAATTLGAYVTTTTTVDASGVVGVVRADASDQSPVIVITRGPILTKVLGTSDNFSTGKYVGTATTAGYTGAWGGYAHSSGIQYWGLGRVGWALQTPSTGDTGAGWVWVDPD